MTLVIEVRHTLDPALGGAILSLLQGIAMSNVETKQLLEELHNKAVQADAKADQILAAQQKTVEAVQGLTGDIDTLKGTIAALQDYINTTLADDPELKALADKAAAALATVATKLDAVAANATAIEQSTTALDAATPAA